MTKTTFVFTAFVVSALLSYAIGYYSASNEVLVFVKVASASQAINTIKYLEDKEYNKALSYQRLNLDENMAVIEDILKNSLKVSAIPSRYLSYKKLFSLDLDSNIEVIQQKYDQITEEQYEEE